MPPDAIFDEKARVSLDRDQKLFRDTVKGMRSALFLSVFERKRAHAAG